MAVVKIRGVSESGRNHSTRWNTEIQTKIPPSEIYRCIVLKKLFVQLLLPKWKSHDPLCEEVERVYRKRGHLTNISCHILLVFMKQNLYFILFPIILNSLK